MLARKALIILHVDCDLETYLAQNSLTCEQFCPKAYDKPDHGEASIPCLGKVNEAESGCCLIGHGSMKRRICCSVCWGFWSASNSGDAVRCLRKACGHWIRFPFRQGFGADIHLAWSWPSCFHRFGNKVPVADFGWHLKNLDWEVYKT